MGAIENIGDFADAVQDAEAGTLSRDLVACIDQDTGRTYSIKRLTVERHEGSTTVWVEIEEN